MISILSFFLFGGVSIGDLRFGCYTRASHHRAFIVYALTLPISRLQKCLAAL